MISTFLAAAGLAGAFRIATGLSKE